MTDWLVHTLVATSGLTLLVLVVREPVRRLFGSRVTYGLWLIPAARLFMPTITRTVERSVPADPPLHLFNDQPLVMAHVAARTPSLIDTIGGWPSVAAIMWLGVATGLFVSRIMTFHSDRRAILRSSSSVSRLGSVRLVRSPAIASPVALGILNPVIAVPADFRRMYGKRERRLVLEHELAHHRSGDLAANLFAFVLLCLQWFNPLAWIAHSAFRFDQEAACDARVLEKARPAERASYGRAIAKAASGRALLFASALDRPTSLQRRLQSMLRNPSPRHRAAGRLLIAASVAIALPVTAGRAIAYVDVPVRAAQLPPAPHPLPEPAEITASAEASAAEPIVPSTPVARVRRHEPVAGGTERPSRVEGDMTIDDEFVTINGNRKRWGDLTPAEMSKVKAAVAKARFALAKARIDQVHMQRDLANIPDQARMAELQRRLTDAQARAAETLRRVAQKLGDGHAPDAFETAVAERLESLENIDFVAIARSVAAIDRQKISADVARATQSMERARIELDRIQARIDADPRK